MQPKPRSPPAGALLEAEAPGEGAQLIFFDIAPATMGTSTSRIGFRSTFYYISTWGLSGNDATTYFGFSSNMYQGFGAGIGIQGLRHSKQGSRVEGVAFLLNDPPLQRLEGCAVIPATRKTTILHIEYHVEYHVTPQVLELWRSLYCTIPDRRVASYGQI